MVSSQHRRGLLNLLSILPATQGFARCSARDPGGLRIPPPPAQLVACNGIILRLLAAFVIAGGYNYDDPAHGGRGRSGGNSHTFVGSRGASVDKCFDTWGTGLQMQDNPTLSAAPGKYHRTSATFKDQLDFNGTLEGIWGGHLMAISFHYPIIGSAPSPAPGPGPAHCTTTPQPCPNHPGRTFCASDKSPGQCDRPSVKKCPPCPPPPPGPEPHCIPPAKPCKMHKQNCCGGPVPASDSTTSWVPEQQGWIEWTAVAVPDMKGNFEQDVRAHLHPCCF
eukprot:SAG31_NODE_7020_length_1814_cov_1.844315_1_plen_278_part_00